ncbi:MAG TPA: hypothetical protein VNG33_08870 [Polyangiaceae bacterium]|nr:hypothetical protein [Polyangiaceae bacterium]
MKTPSNWLLLSVAGSLFWACGGGSSHAGSSSAAGSSSQAGATTASDCGGLAQQGPVSAACVACVEQHCSAVYSAFCSANCGSDSQSSACQKATSDLGTCVFSTCLSECDSGSGSGGVGNDPTGSAGATSSAGQSSTGIGTVTTACYVAELHACTSYLVLSSQRSVYDGQCDANGGVSSDSCPTDNLVGCCTAPGAGGLERCGYDADQSTVTEDDCVQLDGMWSEQP